jgi:hypothetical protein
VPLVLQRNHLIAIGAVAFAGLLFASRGPWSAAAAANPANATGITAAPNGITAVPAGLTTAPQVIYVDQFGRPLTVAPATHVQPLVPAVETAYSVSPQAQPYVRPVSTVRAASSPRVVRVSEHKRSWQKSALIIGGSAGTGAGIGGLVGGKKGAAIGAAIGGGGAALYEAVKR